MYRAFSSNPIGPWSLTQRLAVSKADGIHVLGFGSFSVWVIAESTVMVETWGKRPTIVLSSSSEDEEVDDHDEFEVCDSDDNDDDDDDDDDEDEDEDEDDGEGEGEDEDANDDGHDDEDYDNDDDESLSNKVIHLLQGGNDLGQLRLKECKAYLRKHGLRLAGSKAVCIKRIREHWRLKDGRGYTLYPRSSFIIDCTGDVCKGDVVLFTQKVYEKFNKVTRHGRPLGRRTVAGRVIKESYGVRKQQHTFTVEVIWSSGVKKLSPLFPLLVKGRNLYKLKTYRQIWKNEAERVRVLSEKHRRGAAARLVRATRQKKEKCLKSQNEVQHTRPSKMRRPYEAKKVRHPLGHGKSKSHYQLQELQEATSSREAAQKQNASSTAFRSTTGWHKSTENGKYHYQVPLYPSYAKYPQSSHQSQVNSRSRKEPYEFFYIEGDHIPSRVELPPFRPYVERFVTSRSQNLVPRDFSHAPLDPRYNLEMKNLTADNVRWPLHQPPSRTKMYERR